MVAGLFLAYDFDVDEIVLDGSGFVYIRDTLFSL